MAKSQENKTSALEVVNKANDEMSIVDAKQQFADVVDAFESVGNEQLVSMNSEYLKIEENKIYNFAFLGMQTMQGDNGEDVEVVQLADANGKQFISGATVVVSSLKRATKIPCLCRIVTRGTVKGKRGNYIDCDVYLLASSVAKP